MTTIGTHDTVYDPGRTQISDADRMQYQPSLIRQLGIDTAYVLVGLPLSVLTFVIVIAGLSTGAGYYYRDHRRCRMSRAAA